MRTKLCRFLVSIFLPGPVVANRSQIVAIRRLACAAIEFLKGIIEMCDQALV